MSNSNAGSSKTYNGRTNLSGSASGHFGDRYNIGDNLEQDERHYEDIEVVGGTGILGDANHTVVNKDVTIIKDVTIHNYGSVKKHESSKYLTQHAHIPHSQKSGKRLALLAIEGGVVGGLSCLLALKHFMERVARVQGSDCPPKPCEFFDMIGGVDVGGLIAVLLGSLEFTIDESIETYTRFLSTVINGPLSSRDDPSQSPVSADHALFDQKAVERFIKQILRKQNRSEELLFESPTPVSCKVFVKAFCPQTDTTVLLRSFQVWTLDDERLKYTTLCNAIQATLALSPLFGPIKITHDQFSDHFGCNVHFDSTAAHDIIAEAQALLLDSGQSLGDHLDCLLSIAADVKADNRAIEQADPITKLLLDVSAANKSRNEAFCMLHPTLSSSGQFCHLRVPCELGSPRWPTAQGHDQVAGSLDQYLDSRKVVDSLIACLARLLQRQSTPGFAMTRSSQRPLQPLVRSRSTVPRPDEISTYDARIAHYRRSQPRIRNTCTWILKNPTFLQWCRSSNTSALVCTGTMGCGKSILAAAVIDHVQELQLDSYGVCIHYFFETGTNSSTSLTDMLRAMIKQLILPYGAQSISIPQNISKILSTAFAVQGMQPSKEDLASAFKSLVEISPKCLYLIDGFDDLHESQMQDMFGVLRTVFADHNLHGSKLALFSRETLGRGIEIVSQLQMPRVYSIHLSLSHLSKDIERFVEAQVNEQQLRRKITQNIQLINDIKTRLISHSDKMFLWIYFQIRNIWDPNLSKTDEDISKLIEHLPTGLDRTYEMCLRRLEDHGNLQQQEIAAKAFRWVSVAKQPLTPRQMQEAVSLTASQVELEESEIVNSPITDYCANLLTVDLTRRRVQFAHASVKQFLQNLATFSQDLLRYHIDALAIDRECAGICLGYMKSIQSRKRTLVRQHASISQRIPKTIDSEMFPHASKLASLANFALKRTNRKRLNAGMQRSATADDRRPIRLEMHDYFINYWLSHMSNITPEDPLFSSFKILCQYPDLEMFPWLNSTANQSSLCQQLTQHAVVNRHLPLLKVMRLHISTKLPGMVKTVFEGYCPGTGVRLIHMATALGFRDVLEELVEICDINAFDDQGRSAVMWAIEKPCVDTILWLAQHGDIDLSRSVNLGSHPNMSLCFLACLARLDHDELFWECIEHSPSSLIDAHKGKDLSQALLSACSAGHTSVAGFLISLGASPRESSVFYWPQLEGYGKRSLPETAIASGDIVALLTLINITEDYDPEYYGDVLKFVLSGPVEQASAMSSLLCTTESIAVLRSSLLQEWSNVILLTGSTRKGWTGTVRKVLHAELDHDDRLLRYSMPPMPSGSIRLQGWRTIPDDVAILALRLSYFSVTQVSRFSKEDLLLIKHFLLRGTSRVISKISRSYLINHDLRITRMCEVCLDDRVSVASAEAVVAALYQGNAGANLYPCEQKSPLKEILQKYQLLPWSELQNHQWFPEREGLSLSGLFRLSRCYRVCRGNEKRAIRMYNDLKDLDDNCDVSLNFPAGYMEINGRYMVKLSIVGAFYRWNHRLRRKKDLPYSEADVAYCKAVGWPYCPVGSMFAKHSVGALD